MNRKGSISPMFTSVVIFWIVLTIMFSFAGSSESLNVPQEYSDRISGQDYSKTNLQSNAISLDLLFIFRIMFWQVSGMPGWLSLFLDVFGIFSIYILVQSLKPWGSGG